MFRSLAGPLILSASFALAPIGFCQDAAPRIAFPLPSPSTIGAEKFCQILSVFLSQGGYESWQHDRAPHPTGPYYVRKSGAVESTGTHGPAAVKVYYSPEVWTWMQGGNKGVIADGGMIVKTLYARNPLDPTKFSDSLTGFSVMVKDSRGSWDGWFYSDGGPFQKPEPDAALTFFDPNAGFAISCINCHAAADNVESTYSSARNVSGTPIPHETVVSSWGLKRLQALAAITPEPVAPPKSDLTKPAAARIWPYLDEAAKSGSLAAPNPLPISTLDHLPQGPRPDGQRPFVTASNCSACHDAADLHSPTTNMIFSEKPDAGEAKLYNLSAFSEWRYSMMGLAGRDPVFFAQLESERALHPELADKIDDTCLSCHGVMGQRQFHFDHATVNPPKHRLLTTAIASAVPGSANEKYGALARDGVSCMVCHQIAPEGLGDVETYSGRFKLQEKHNAVFGPYEKASVIPMEHALGLTPKLGTHLADSKLCASCHAISMPSLTVGPRYTPNEFDEEFNRAQSGHIHEQATYLEWKNSVYSTETAAKTPAQRSCQDCHMPREFNGKQLRFRVANVEDETFPPVDHRAADDQLRLEYRDRYSRHTLNGINVFVLEMFKQNPTLLGVPLNDNLFTAPNVVPGFDLAIDSARKMAREQSAKVEILQARREGNKLIAQVQITNLTGHKFPSGVNFRRAFIEFKVEAEGKVVWASGSTDEWGVIGNRIDGKFAPLKTEFFKAGEFQPHYVRIMRESQVQIYESLVADSEGNLTTSFLNIKNTIKDNRLLPRGWKADGPDAEVTRPTGTDDDPNYSSGEGKDVVTYEAQLNVPAGQALTVTATLHYQTLPPYYLRQRFDQLAGPATQRLFYLVNHVDLKDSAAQWMLTAGQDKKEVK